MYLKIYSIEICMIASITIQRGENVLPLASLQQFLEIASFKKKNHFQSPWVLPQDDSKIFQHASVCRFQVNVIPVIAKADTMTPEEVLHFKRQIMNQILQAKIRIYEFPDEGDLQHTSNGESRNGSNGNDKIKERVPFAVVGSNCLIEGEGGKKIRGRKYPWGIVDVSEKKNR